MTFENWQRQEKDDFQPVLWTGNPDQGQATVLQDKGSRDGITKVLFGVGRSNSRSANKRKNKKAKKSDKSRNFVHWIQKLLLLDAISYTSRGRVFQIPLTRSVLVSGSFSKTIKYGCECPLLKNFVSNTCKLRVTFSQILLSAQILACFNAVLLFCQNIEFFLNLMIFPLLFLGIGHWVVFLNVDWPLRG